MAIWLPVIVVVGYLLGTLPTGYLAGRLRGIDIRDWGSGATGGTNVMRTLGIGTGIGVGLVDLAKGLLSAYLGYRLAGDWGYTAGGFAALVGHSYPVWLKFKGGKSVATGAGAVMIFYPLPFLAGLLALLAVVIPTRYVSLGSLVGSAVLWVGVLLSGPPLPHLLLVSGAVAVVYIRHWENIKRLAAGKENKFGQRATPRT